MSKHRRAARIDSNQNAIVRTLRAIPGVSVEPGHDDILVGYKGKTFWFEVKDPQKILNKDGSFRAGEIKPSQEKLLKEFEGHYAIVWDVDMILFQIGIL